MLRSKSSRCGSGLLLPTYPPLLLEQTYPAIVSTATRRCGQIGHPPPGIGDGDGDGHIPPGDGDGTGTGQPPPPRALQHVAAHTSPRKPEGGAQKNGNPSEPATSDRRHSRHALLTDVGAYPPAAAPLLYPPTSQCTANSQVSSALGSKAVSRPPSSRSPSDKPEQLEGKGDGEGDGHGDGHGDGEGVAHCRAKQHVCRHTSRK